LPLRKNLVAVDEAIVRSSTARFSEHRHTAGFIIFVTRITLTLSGSN